MDTNNTGPRNMLGWGRSKSSLQRGIRFGCEGVHQLTITAIESRAVCGHFWLACPALNAVQQPWPVLRNCNDCVTGAHAFDCVGGSVGAALAYH